jgi:hypothetical protein
LNIWKEQAMALDDESFAVLLPTVQRFVRERLVPAEDEVHNGQQGARDHVPVQQV